MYNRPISLIVAPYLPGTGTNTGYPDGVRQLQIPYRLDAWTHTVTAKGGEESAEARLTTPQPLAQQWFGAVGANVRAFDSHAARIFHGTVATVVVNDGARETSQTTDGMANAVRVQYTRYGRTVATTLAQNSDSRARFFRRELVFSVGEMSSTEATARRDNLLAALAWPLEATASGLTTKPGRGEASVTLLIRGWWYGLSWSAAKVATKTTTGATNTLVTNIVNDALDSSAPATWGNDALFVPGTAFVSFTGPSTDAGGGPLSAFPKTSEYQYADELVSSLLERGTSTGGKLAYGFNLPVKVDLDNALSFFYARAWAGASPTQITYYLRAPNVLLGASLCPFPWSQARPDTMAQHLGVSPRPPIASTSTLADGGGRFWVERVQYSWSRESGEELRLEPQGSLDAAAVLARMR